VDFPEDAARASSTTTEGSRRPEPEREIATVCRKIARDVVAKKAPMRTLSDGAATVGASPASGCRVTSTHRFATAGRRARTKSGW
jgi:hypothetical protein